MDIHVILFCSFFEYTSTNIVSEVIPCSSFICGSQQELGSCTTIHIFFGFLITLLLTLLQVNYQKSGNPFETHGAIMLLFIIVVFVYTLALAGISQPTSNKSYLPILRRVCFISGAFACDLLLMILVPPFGWFILELCICMFVQLLFESRQLILCWFEQTFQSIKRFTSQAFNILGGWFQNSIQSLHRATSRAFHRSPMLLPTQTEQQVVEIAVIRA